MNIGDRVWAVSTPRCRRGETVFGYRTVSRVGRKYFELSDLPHTRFRLDDWREDTEYSKEWVLYESEQVWREGVRRNTLANALSVEFRQLRAGEGYTLSQLEQVASILGLSIPGDSDG